MAKATKAVETTPATTDNATTVNPVMEVVKSDESTQSNEEAKPTLETLQGQLKEQKDVIKNHILGGGEMDDQPVLAANMEIIRLNNAIKAEQARLDKVKREQEVSEAKNARVALATNLVNAVLASIGFDAATLTDEQKAQFQPQLDVVTTELLAKYPTSAPAKKAESGENTGEAKGAKTKEIRARYDAYIAEGKNSTDAIKAIIAEGYSRGTTGAVVLAYQKELGQK